MAVPLPRVREHVNPLSRRYQTPVALPDWRQVYAQTNRPWHLDLGCGPGRFLRQMAEARPDWNFLGLEIRTPLVLRAQAQAQGFTNLYYLAANANVCMAALGGSMPLGCVQLVSIQFPDPWFKHRHQKRRLVQSSLVHQLSQILPAGARVFCQSDILEVAEQMRRRFSAHPLFSCSPDQGWLAANPLPVASERELSTLQRGLPVYRLVVERQAQPL